MSEIKKIIEQIDDNIRVTIDVPMTNGDTQRIDGILKKTSLPPSFEILYPPGILKTESLEYKSKCILSAKHEEKIVNLEIHIDGADNNALTCTAFSSIKPEKLREYFRVMIKTSIRASYKPGPKEIKISPWILTGDTIDLSGGGVLAIFQGKPGSNNHIQLEIDIPGQKTSIRCKAQVIRTYRMRQKRYQVAFSFEDIEHKAKDIIISCCLQEQRRQLREKVRV